MRRALGGVARDLTSILGVPRLSHHFRTLDSKIATLDLEVPHGKRACLAPLGQWWSEWAAMLVLGLLIQYKFPTVCCRPRSAGQVAAIIYLGSIAQTPLNRMEVLVFHGIPVPSIQIASLTRL